MSEKPKLKNKPTSIIRYYWDVLLFARSFKTEVKAPPHEAAAMFDQIFEHDTFFNSRDQVSKVSREEDDVYAFDIRVRRRSGSNHRTSVHAKGRILHSAGYGTTVIHGHLRLGRLYFVSLIVAILYLPVMLLRPVLEPGFSFESSHLIPAVGGVIFFLYLAYSLRQVYNDYHLLNGHLQKMIHALRPAQIDT